MRYRPLGSAGAAISNLTLSLGVDALSRGAEAVRDLVFAALEAGVNGFRLETADPVLAQVLGESLRDIDRKLVCVSLTLGQGDGRRGSLRDFSAEGMTGAIDRALHVSGLGWIDVALLHEPGEDELPQSSLTALKTLRATGRVRYLGVSGDGEVMDAYVSTGAFDILASPLHVNSDWRVLSRLRAAREQDMSIFAYDYFPEALRPGRRAAPPADGGKRGLFGLGARKPAVPAVADAFAFLHRTSNWNAEAVCLAFVLTNPSISSVLVKPRDIEELNALAVAVERDLPPGLAAQIEMARISGAAA